MEFFALEGEIQLALRIAALGVLTVPVAAVPDHDGASAILALRNGAFEVAIVQRMILDLNCEPLVMRIERGSLGDGPGFEDAVQFESQVVVQVRCRMLLNHEAEIFRRLDLRISAGFGRLREVAFGSVFCKQLFDHDRHRRYLIPAERKVPAAVKVPTIVEDRNGASCLLEWIA